MQAQSPNKKALIELERHIEIGNISEPISNRLKEYFLNGGELDDTDWLYFLQSKSIDTQEKPVAELVEKRNEPLRIKSETITQVLKEAGFFLESSFEEKKTYRILKKELVETSVNLALNDSRKALLIDLEADVAKDNFAYKQFIQQLAAISDRNFIPLEIMEKWESETGPIKVTFEFQEKRFSFMPEYMDDWLDGRVIGEINNAMNKIDCGFYTIQSDYITGQEILIIFLYKKEKDVLEKKLNWELELLK